MKETLQRCLETFRVASSVVWALLDSTRLLLEHSCSIVVLVHIHKMSLQEILHQTYELLFADLHLLFQRLLCSALYVMRVMTNVIDIELTIPFQQESFRRGSSQLSEGKQLCRPMLKRRDLGYSTYRCALSDSSLLAQTALGSQICKIPMMLGRKDRM